MEEPGRRYGAITIRIDMRSFEAQAHQEPEKKTRSFRYSGDPVPKESESYYCYHPLLLHSTQLLYRPQDSI